MVLAASLSAPRWWRKTGGSAINLERSRSRYVTDVEFNKVYGAAIWFVQDSMDLALLLGQRPAVVFKIQLCDVQENHIAVFQNKTGAKLRIQRTGELAAEVQRVQARDRLSTNSEAQLVVCNGGKPTTASIFRSAFDLTRELAGVTFQLPDLRAKAATDTNDLARSQSLLGHMTRNTTEAYVCNRLEASVKPLR